MSLSKAAPNALHVGFTAALRRVWYWAVVFGLYSTVPVLIGRTPWSDQLDVSSIVDASFAFIIGFLLVFRMNRAYERWWEARTLWGTLVNVSRNLAVKAKTLVEPDEMERSRLRTLVVGFSYGLKEHLRGHDTLRDVPGFDDTDDAPSHVPSYIVEQIYGLFSAWESAGKLAREHLWMLDREARVLLDVTGGCERIKNTLMAQSFPALTRQAIVLYLLYLPWSLTRDYGYTTVLFTILVAYFIIAAEGIAHYVERPFGLDDDHLDLEAICAGIDTTVSEILER